MTQEEYNEVTNLEKKLMDTLQAAFETGDPAGELAQKAAELHEVSKYQINKKINQLPR